MEGPSDISRPGPDTNYKLPGGFMLKCFLAPVPPIIAGKIMDLVQQQASAACAPEVDLDLHLRMQEQGNLFAVCFAGPTDEHDIVSHAHIAFDPRTRPSVGFLSHVFTSAQDNEINLTTQVVNAALDSHAQVGGRYWVCSSSTNCATYEALGFEYLNQFKAKLGLPSVMLKTYDSVAADELFKPAACCTYRVEAATRDHLAALVLLLNSHPEHLNPKLEQLGIFDGTETQKVIDAIAMCAPGIGKQNRVGLVLLVDFNGHVHGIQTSSIDSSVVQVYIAPEVEAVEQAKSAALSTFRSFHTIRFVPKPKVKLATDIIKKKRKKEKFNFAAAQQRAIAAYGMHALEIDEFEGPQHNIPNANLGPPTPALAAPMSSSA